MGDLPSLILPDSGNTSAGTVTFRPEQADWPEDKTQLFSSFHPINHSVSGRMGKIHWPLLDSGLKEVKLLHDRHKGSRHGHICCLLQQQRYIPIISEDWNKTDDSIKAFLFYDCRLNMIRSWGHFNVMSSTSVGQAGPWTLSAQWKHELSVSRQQIRTKDWPGKEFKVLT